MRYAEQPQECGDPERTRSEIGGRGDPRRSDWGTLGAPTAQRDGQWRSRRTGIPLPAPASSSNPSASVIDTDRLQKEHLRETPPRTMLPSPPGQDLNSSRKRKHGEPDDGVRGKSPKVSSGWRLRFDWVTASNQHHRLPAAASDPDERKPLAVQRGGPAAGRGYEAGEDRGAARVADSEKILKMESEIRSLRLIGNHHRSPNDPPYYNHSADLMTSKSTCLKAKLEAEKEKALAFESARALNELSKTYSDFRAATGAQILEYQKNRREEIERAEAAEAAIRDEVNLAQDQIRAIEARNAELEAKIRADRVQWDNERVQMAAMIELLREIEKDTKEKQQLESRVRKNLPSVHEESGGEHGSGMRPGEDEGRVAADSLSQPDTPRDRAPPASGTAPVHSRTTETYPPRASPPNPPTRGAADAAYTRSAPVGYPHVYIPPHMRAPQPPLPRSNAFTAPAGGGFAVATPSAINNAQPCSSPSTSSSADLDAGQRPEPEVTLFKHSICYAPIWGPWGVPVSPSPTPLLIHQTKAALFVEDPRRRMERKECDQGTVAIKVVRGRSARL
ncbi:hypothetical protein BDK51DRAFT_37137, partial [Blyttiomyces helicus]